MTKTNMGKAVAKSNKRAWRKLDATAAEVSFITAACAYVGKGCAALPHLVLCAYPRVCC